MQNEKTMLDKKISFVIPCYYSEKSVEGVVNDIFKEFPVLSLFSPLSSPPFIR